MKRLGFLCLSIAIWAIGFASTAYASISQTEYVALKTKDLAVFDVIRVAEEKSLADVLAIATVEHNPFVEGGKALVNLVFAVEKPKDERNPNNTNSNEYLAINLKQLYVKELETQYFKFRNDPDVSVDYLEKYTLEAFLQTLNKDASSPKEIQDSPDYLIERFKVVATHLHSLTESRILQKAGVITGTEKSVIDAAATKTAAENMTKTNDTASCFKIGENPITECIDAGVSWFIKNTLLRIAGFFVWFGANVLNYAVQIGILNFKTFASDALYPLWVVVRQIVSLFIVFAGLYLGFLYIIGREKAFENFFPWLILFALFVNFSYPLTRTFVDVSNIVALNVYSSAFGNDALTGSAADLFDATKSTPGALIMSKLGLQKVVDKATTKASGSLDLISGINSTPGALAAVAFVLYAAYIFFMAAGILVVRTILLIFLTIVSPILLVDSVIPGLGEKAKMLRKLFFEQLVVAPVFMIMLALTLKFFDVFTSAGVLSTGSVGSLSGTGGATIVQFFNLLMMLVMLNITFKVTKHVAGSAGEYGTNFMGKVGGFGLGAASAGTGFLARGTLGKVAAATRDAKWMDSIQGSRTGRGLYMLTNSLANSTYDTRNVGAVSKGFTKAGMGSGFLGIGGMGKGSEMTQDKIFKAKDEATRKKYESIKDGEAREKFIRQREGKGKWSANYLGIRTDDQITAEKIRDEEGKKIKHYDSLTSADKKLEYLNSLPENLQNQIRARVLAPNVAPAAAAAAGAAPVPAQSTTAQPNPATSAQETQAATTPSVGTQAFSSMAGNLTSTSILATRKQKQQSRQPASRGPGGVTPPPVAGFAAPKGSGPSGSSPTPPPMGAPTASTVTPPPSANSS